MEMSYLSPKFIKDLNPTSFCKRIPCLREEIKNLLHLVLHQAFFTPVSNDLTRMKNDRNDFVWRESGARRSCVTSSLELDAAQTRDRIVLAAKADVVFSFA